MMRVFWAIELSPEIRSALREFQNGIRNRLPAISWVKPESLHLTVKFLGEIGEEQLSSIQQVVEDGVMGCSPFYLKVEGVGGFPNIKQPRVLWVGVSGDVESLQNLANRVEHGLIPLGFPAESKAFRGHLTLARIKQGNREVGTALAKSQFLDQQNIFGVLRVHTLSLFRSELKPTGAVYHRLKEIQLKEK